MNNIAKVLPTEAEIYYKGKLVHYPSQHKQPEKHNIIFRRVFTPHPMAGSEQSTQLQKTVTFSGLTIVTAYFDIGTFNKHNLNCVHNSKLYLKWIKKYSLLTNPLIVYVDSQRNLEYFKSVRHSLLPTKFVLVNRTQLWAFSLLNETSRIFHQSWLVQIIRLT